MTSIPGVWLAVGVVLGSGHAAGLWRSAAHLTAMTAAGGTARLLAVGLALAAAATWGGLLPVAAGWAAGFFVSVAVVAATRRGSGRGRAAR